MSAEGGELSVSRGLRRTEAGRAATAQVGNDRPVAGGMERRKDTVPGPRIVRPAVQQERRAAVRGTRHLAGDRQRRCAEMLELRFAHETPSVCSGLKGQPEEPL